MRGRTIVRQDYCPRLRRLTLCSLARERGRIVAAFQTASDHHHILVSLAEAVEAVRRRQDDRVTTVDPALLPLDEPVQRHPDASIISVFAVLC